MFYNVSDFEIKMFLVKQSFLGNMLSKNHFLVFMHRKDVKLGIFMFDETFFSEKLIFGKKTFKAKFWKKPDFETKFQRVRF